MNQTSHSNDKFLFVGNPTSHSGKAAKRIELATQIMIEKKLDFEFRPTLPNGKTVELVKKAIDEEHYRTVIYMGGDGTFLEVATGICISSCPDKIKIGMLPSGTANDQGKSFGISSSPGALDENINIITAGHIQPLDVGHVKAFDDHRRIISDDFFFDSIGWGLSAAILSSRNKELKTIKKMPLWRDMYRDQAVYVRAAMHQLAINWVTRDRFIAEVEVDGTTHTLDYLSDLTISNTLVYAGEWIIDPSAKPDDGIIEISPFRGIRDWTSKLIIHHKKNSITPELLDKIGLSHAPVIKGKNITIHILRPSVDKRLPAQRDGEEYIAADHYHIEVLPKLLNVIVPKNFHWI